MMMITMALLLCSSIVNCQSYNDQSVTLYVTSPSCATYKCEVIKHPGDKLTINWLNAPRGDVKLLLVSETDHGPTYTINPNVAGTQKNCYHGDTGKRPCGQYSTTVPSQWAYGKYSVQVVSIQTGKTGYTDIVKIAPQGSTRTMRRAQR